MMVDNNGGAMTDDQIRQAYLDAYGWGIDAAGISDMRDKAASWGWDGLRQWFLTHPQEIGKPGLPFNYFDQSVNLPALSYVPQKFAALDSTPYQLATIPQLLPSSVPVAMGNTSTVKPMTNLSTAPMSDAEIAQALSDAFGSTNPPTPENIANIKLDAQNKGWDGVRQWFLVRPQQLGLKGLSPDYFDTGKKMLYLGVAAVAVWYFFFRKHG